MSHSVLRPTVVFDGALYRMWFVGVHTTDVPYGGRVQIWYGGEDDLPPHSQRIGMIEADLGRGPGR